MATFLNYLHTLARPTAPVDYVDIPGAPIKLSIHDRPEDEYFKVRVYDLNGEPYNHEQRRCPLKMRDSVGNLLRPLYPPDLHESLASCLKEHNRFRIDNRAAYFILTKDTIYMLHYGNDVVWTWAELWVAPDPFPNCTTRQEMAEMSKAMIQDMKVSLILTFLLLLMYH